MPSSLKMPTRPLEIPIATTSSASGESPPPPWRRLPSIRPRQILRMAGSTFTALRYLPIFTPRQTLARWRSHRAIRAAARQARKPGHDRDWTDRFRLNGLTWHHLYISQDLRRIQLFLRELQMRLAANPDDAGAAAAVVPLERSFAYLLDNVWDVYNTLERQVFFPWIEGAVPDDVAVAKALLLFGKERTRIEDSADAVQSRFSRLVCSTGHPYSSLGPCSTPWRLNAHRIRRQKRKKEAQAAKARADALSGVARSDQDARSKKEALQMREGYRPEEGKYVRPVAIKRVSVDELRQISMDVADLIEDTETLHRTERGLLYPLIANTFSEREQARLTNVMVYSMRSVLAKFIITIYHQAVEKNATRAQWKWYKREVPLPIRVYTPVWRKRLFDGSPLGWLRQTPVKSLGR